MECAVDTVSRQELQPETDTGSPAAIEGAIGGNVTASIILPAYNEAAALPTALASLFAVLDDRCEVIVVDDGSTDATAAIAAVYPCRLLRHKQNYGKGTAVRTGLLASRGRFIIVMDADNTYPAEAVPAIIALSEDYEFVRCVRQDSPINSPRLNRIGNKFFDVALKVMHGLEGTDHLSGLYGLRREAFDAIQVTASRFDLEIEVAIKARARRLTSISLPIHYGPRLGEKKLDPWQDGFAILREMIRIALLYNPGLIFVLPGFLIWLVAAILVFILSQGSIVTPYVGRLDVNSFIVASLGMTVGFQFVVFGIAAALFGVEEGAQPGRWLVVLSHTRTRLWTGLVGLIFSVVGGSVLAIIIGRWLAAGGGVFRNTRDLVLAGALLTWGVQWILAVLFISIFASRLARARNGVRVGELLSDARELSLTEPHHRPTDSSIPTESAVEQVTGASPGANPGTRGVVV
jgi:glycosyltransferase involved in cell wall biosynthesis